MVLIRWLPAQSALHREMDPEGAPWTATSYLVANLIDVEQTALWQRSGGKGSPPKPIRRPAAPGTRRTWEEKMLLYEEHKRERQRELEVMASGN